MVQCAKIRVKHRTLCAGDLDRRISVLCRSLKAPTDSTTDFKNEFTKTKKLWAALRTTSGTEVFVDTNLAIEVTHIFYIRHMTTMKADKWLEFKGKNYDILKVENIDGRDEWEALWCNERGCGELELNHA